jgi:hypothetical protein
VNLVSQWKRELGALARFKPANPLMLDLGIKIAAKHGVTVALLRGTGRAKHLIFARLDFILGAINLGKNTGEIARFLNRDRTTINHYIRMAR